ncbi:MULTISPECIES: LysR family transcriptional regulator [Acetobacter]|uniref:LysR family transcriptional regulator n=3 Tax=Acetobacter TaxID=434 RepID=A0A5B9GES2_9PROT|nr:MULTISPECIES: LysR family transcriptional regulator [Acetobacter]AKR48550.1 LysR family transcriptional regulator [Acetobacter pasteurianus]ARW47124.1 RuBisCO operon transcriptional regulator [Acetobacter pasteurianus subsp. pasteurianus]MCP1201893.1 LysR family transcriptional regulator [Acetobacter oryzoeni]QEE84611.1 LysR family transcriptional regulator [Acetobacter oryzoeni]
MNVSLEQLEAFVATADAGSFSAAARRLGRAQSAISTHVANLEVDLGLELFLRTGRTPVLTPEGERLLREARVVLDRREHLIGVARSLEDQVENRLVVAIDELYPEHALGPVFAEFAEHFPYVEMEILFPLMEDVGQLVQEGAAHLGVMWQQTRMPPDLAFRTIGRVPLKLVCGRSHPLAQCGPVAWEDLKRYRQIMVAARGQERERQHLRVAGEVWWVESHWVILELVKHNIGWSFISDHILEASPAAPDIVTPPLAFDAGDRPVPLAVVWHHKRPQGAAARWLRQRLCGSESVLYKRSNKSSQTRDQM